MLIGATGCHHEVAIAGLAACKNACDCEAKLPIQELPPTPADVMFALDISGSMNQPLENAAATTRWEALFKGMSEVLPSFKKAEHRVGLLTFPDLKAAGRQASCAVSGEPAVPFTNSVEMVGAELRRIRPVDDALTPMFAALQSVRRYLMSVNDATRPRVVVLGTDGLPNCTSNFNDQATQQVAGLIKQLRADTKAQVAVFGISTRQTTEGALLRSLLNQLADAGGVPFNDNDEHFFSVDSPQALLKALRGLTATAGDCRFRIAQTPKGMKVLRIKLDSQPVEKDAQNGWDDSGADPKEVRLYGKACEEVRRGSAVAISAVFHDAACPDPTPSEPAAPPASSPTRLL